MKYFCKLLPTLKKKQSDNCLYEIYG